MFVRLAQRFPATACRPPPGQLYGQVAVVVVVVVGLDLRP